MIDLPRGKYLGRRVGEPARDDAEHFNSMPSLRRVDRLPRLGVRLRARRAVTASGTGSAAMTKKKRRYELRVFDGRIIYSA
jgi:hypothetical protein